MFKAYATKHLHAHDFIWLRWNKIYYSTQPNKKVIEIRLKCFKNKIHETLKITSHSHQTYLINKPVNKPLVSQGIVKNQFLRTTVGRVIINQEFQKHINASSVKYAQN